MPSSSTTPMKHSTTDVLIIGAGPSGLMAAQALARLGIDVRVIDKRKPGEQYGNADGLSPRTLEIWKTYDMFDTIASKAAHVYGMVAYETSQDRKSLIRSNTSKNIVVSSRYPFEIGACISDIEATLREKAEAASAKFTQSSWPISVDVEEVDSTEEGKYPVKVTVEQDIDVRELEVIHAKYLIGADGAYSWIRRSLGIKMEGEQTEDVWGVVDVLLETDFLDYRFKCVIQTLSGALIIIPREGDKLRLYVQLSALDSIPRREDGRLDKTAFDPEVILKKILSRARERLSPYRVEFTHVFWSTIFSTAQTVANRFSYKNRVFIAGDACHTHSPKAGQGANASMGDTHNLAWKLAHVIRGWAKPSLLRTYEEERRKYAQELITFDRDISMSLEGQTAAEYQRMMHKQNMFTSGVGISYASSSLTISSQTKTGQISPGERFPSYPILRLADWHPLDAHDLLVSDGKFKLILLPGDLLDQKSKSILHQFGKAFKQACQIREADYTHVNRDHKSRLAVYTITSSQREDVTWKDVPSQLVESWRCCFSSHSTSPNDALYSQFGLSNTGHCSGASVLVRPDGYISMISGLEAQHAHKLITYIYNL